MSSHATQRSRILELLTSAGGTWVPLPKILELKISQFGARILELRRSGLKIENRTETIDGQRYSWYRLELGSSASPNSARSGTNAAPAVAVSLFADPGQVSYRDPEEGWR